MLRSIKSSQHPQFVPGGGWGGEGGIRVQLRSLSSDFIQPFDPLERLASNFSLQYHRWIKY